MTEYLLDLTAEEITTLIYLLSQVSGDASTPRGNADSILEKLWLAGYTFDPEVDGPRHTSSGSIQFVSQPNVF